MEDFQRKACLVAGGHMTTATSGAATYASVVSCALVQIALTIAAIKNRKCLFNRTCGREDMVQTWFRVQVQLWQMFHYQLGAQWAQMSSSKYIQGAVLNIKAFASCKTLPNMREEVG
jgi:hypothetical protein